MSELIAVSVLLGDRTYRIKILPKDEEVVRRTVKTINDKVLEFKTQFAGKDMQDYIAMVLIWYATEQSAEAGAGAEQEGFGEQLSILEKLIDNQLQH